MKNITLCWTVLIPLVYKMAPLYFGGGVLYGEKKFTRRSVQRQQQQGGGGVCTCKIKKISLIFTRILFSILKKGPLDVCPLHTSHFLSIFPPRDLSPVNGHTKHDRKACFGQNFYPKCHHCIL